MQFGCEVRDFDPTPYLGPKEARRVDRVTQLGFAAAADALADAGELGADPSRCAVIAAPASAGSRRSRSNEATFLEKGAEPGQPVPRADDDGERDRRHDRDALRLDRPEPLHRHRVRGGRATRSARARASSATAAPTS